MKFYKNQENISKAQSKKEKEKNKQRKRQKEDEKVVYLLPVLVENM